MRRLKMLRYTLIVLALLAIVGIFLLFYLPLSTAPNALMAVLSQTWYIYLIVIAAALVIYLIIWLLFGKKK